jgi:hypothetical protein
VDKFSYICPYNYVSGASIAEATCHWKLPAEVTCPEAFLIHDDAAEVYEAVTQLICNGVPSGEFKDGWMRNEEYWDSCSLWHPKYSFFTELRHPGQQPTNLYVRLSFSAEQSTAVTRADYERPKQQYQLYEAQS